MVLVGPGSLSGEKQGEDVGLNPVLQAAHTVLGDGTKTGMQISLNAFAGVFLVIQLACL